ncbi:MAG: hypothetical protein LBJ84_04620 [Oscillospiraceae bacterium]|jgi:hypothetical protein|nr:hypothetical protein [Oscillospiraceae bacterium]
MKHLAAAALVLSLLFCLSSCENSSKSYLIPQTLEEDVALSGFITEVLAPLSEKSLGPQTGRENKNIKRLEKYSAARIMSYDEYSTFLDNCDSPWLIAAEDWKEPWENVDYKTYSEEKNRFRTASDYFLDKPLFADVNNDGVDEEIFWVDEGGSMGYAVSVCEMNEDGRYEKKLHFFTGRVNLPMFLMFDGAVFATVVASDHEQNDNGEIERIFGAFTVYHFDQEWNVTVARVSGGIVSEIDYTDLLRYGDGLA